MNYNQSCAAKGERYGKGQRPLFIRSMQRAAVNVYKTETSFEMLVFAPGRIKEHFKLDVAGREFTVSYAAGRVPAPRLGAARVQPRWFCAHVHT